MAIHVQPPLTGATCHTDYSHITCICIYSVHAYTVSALYHISHCYTAAVHKAYKMLEEEEQRSYVLEMVEDAKAKLDMEVYITCIRVYACIYMYMRSGRETCNTT